MLPSLMKNMELIAERPQNYEYIEPMIARKILVFGGTGHVGAGLVQSLATAGFEVLSISRRPPRSARRVVHPAVDYLQASVYEPALWRQHCQGALALIDAIGALSASTRHSKNLDELNFEPCRITLEESRAAGIPGYVYISARTFPLPFLGEYYRSKHKAEHLVQNLHPQGLIVRPGMVMRGPRWLEDVFKALPLLTAGSEVNDLVLDYCQALLTLA